MHQMLLKKNIIGDHVLLLIARKVSKIRYGWQVCIRHYKVKITKMVVVLLEVCSVCRSYMLHLFPELRFGLSGSRLDPGKPFLLPCSSLWR